ncbi:MAG TPA: aminopeptidase [Microscillaceae bacterium]|nr:aminopeptidase [Microscillaceae bacterium]
MKKHMGVVAMWLLYTLAVQAQTPKQPYTSSKFEQLGTELPTPNNYRTASGAPGHEYWQQKADYKIKVNLDDATQTITGSETITYTNLSPDPLQYLWLQLDQNMFHKDSETYNTLSFKLDDPAGFYAMLSWFRGVTSDGGFEILAVRDANGKELPFTINRTMMRIDLPQTLKAKGGQFTFSVDWKFKVIEASKLSGRGGYEFFPQDGNYIYEMAQWFPRMAVYSDVYGWQNKQFLGRGEFALTFGDYEVAITAPEDHVVASTGELQNPNEVLSSAQRKRLEQAKNADLPVLIVTPEEARDAEKNKASKTKTWIYKAENVRDFAWASSRKFIWDAKQVNVGNKPVWAMSYYPNEGNPLWGDFSTNVVGITLEVYSKHSIDYPYPVAISVHGPVYGMEYPMICFNGGRPNPDGTFSDNTKYGMISVIIHEVGHNFFPMIINSDERQWSWMDEGLNTFLQYLTEVEVPKQAWAKDVPPTYPSRRGPADKIVPYMKTDQAILVPIMTNSEQIAGNQFGNNAYGKPATALNILRETVMGRELFDYAFKTYSQRWAFKHPEPADFFRSMEDASAVDLDWFWRGWFYATEPVEVSLEKVQKVKISENETAATTTAENGFELMTFNVSSLPDLARNARISQEEIRLMENPANHYYLLNFKNNGGLLTPLIIEANYTDGTSDVFRIPAEIWRLNPTEVNKMVMTQKEVSGFIFDPYLETSDIDVSNNTFPRGIESASKFQQFKNGKGN